jgi:co-chaperonin GroES (HSP10)
MGDKPFNYLTLMQQQPEIMKQYPSVPDSLLVEIESRYKEEIQTESGIKFFVDTRFRPEWHVTITGRAVSAPEKLNLKPPFDGIKPVVKPGDEVAFSYLVLFDNTFSDDFESVFFEDAPFDPFITTYSNKKGLRLMTRYRLDDRYDCAAFDEDGLVYERMDRLSQKEKDNWLGKFRFKENADMKFNNLLEYKGEEFWMVHYGHILAVKRGEEIVMVGSNVLIEEYSRSEVNEGGKIILLEGTMTKERPMSTGKIISIGEPKPMEVALNVGVGDTVVYDARYAQTYELWGKEYKVLQQKHLLAQKP